MKTGDYIRLATVIVVSIFAFGCSSSKSSRPIGPAMSIPGLDQKMVDRTSIAPLTEGQQKPCCIRAAKANQPCAKCSRKSGK